MSRCLCAALGFGRLVGFAVAALEDDATCESWCGSDTNPWEKCCAWLKCSTCDACTVPPTQCLIPTSSGSTKFDIASTTSYTVHPSFLSFTIDTMHIRKGQWNGCDLKDAKNIALARSMAPAFLRIGGTSADNVTYDMSMPPEDPPYVPSNRGDKVSAAQIIPHSTLNVTDWDAINAFAEAAGWEIIFGLNIFDGWELGTRTWDPTRSLALMNYTKANGHPVVGWELGNEPNLKGKHLQSSEVADAFASFFGVVNALYESTGAGTREAPWLIGPDVTKGQSAYLESVLEGMPSPGVDVVTWHHYYVAGAGNPVTACNFTQTDFLDKYCEYAEEAREVFVKYSAKRFDRSTQLWMGETSGAGGATAGAKDVFGNFIGVFWYADKLGFAASTGHSVVARQDWMEARGALDDPAPEFWLALLWKRFVGRGVLNISKTSGSPTTRGYAHCSSDGSATAIILNLANSTEQVSLNLGITDKPELEEYHLTSWPSPGDLLSTSVAVNGQPVRLSDAGEVPDFTPRSSVQDTVTVAGLSVAFVIFPAGTVKTCGNENVVV